ncbi:hypothetical protein NDU88_004437 [Pleurodeles waltl]|uniref:Uncharacterized protein n=1 Tax=Pleurodeles waltl TaxID=8319 RepID=A0AAV7UFN9_PLEWA|nr:hypothetical protein NDU88_004437 [Pleurodeles waltl]
MPRRWIPAAGVPTGPPPCRGGGHRVSGATPAHEARVRPGRLEALSGRRAACGAALGPWRRPWPRDPPTRGNLNLEACWGSGPARRSEWCPGGGKEVNRRPGGGGRRRRAVTPPPPHPCSNKRGLAGLEAWFRPLSGPGPGGARAGLRQNLDCEPSSGGQHLGASGYPGFWVVLG